MSQYSNKVEALIHRLKTPTQIQRWIHSLAYNPTETMRALPGVVRTNSAHCLEAAMAAAAILEHHGYPPLILDLESTDLLDHTLLLYKQKERYGSVAMSRDIGLYGRTPIYPTVRGLVRSYAIPYIDGHAAIKAFGVLDLRTLSNSRWRNSAQNVWYVEEALRTIPHTKISIPKNTVRRWRQRYIAFKKKYPARQPDYYPDQAAWA